MVVLEWSCHYVIRRSASLDIFRVNIMNQLFGWERNKWKFNLKHRHWWCSSSDYGFTFYIFIIRNSVRLKATRLRKWRGKSRDRFWCWSTVDDFAFWVLFNGKKCSRTFETCTICSAYSLAWKDINWTRSAKNKPEKPSRWCKAHRCELIFHLMRLFVEASIEEVHFG